MRRPAHPGARLSAPGAVVSEQALIEGGRGRECLVEEAKVPARLESQRYSLSHA
jgi:hypothetical protein